jgi:hypothetical protein
MCWIVRSLPSASLTLTFFRLLQAQTIFPQTSQGSFRHAQGLGPQTPHGCGGFTSHTHGRVPHWVHTSSSTGSPSHSNGESYQKLFETKDSMEAIEGIKRGLESMKRNAGKPAEKFFQELFVEKGISERE